MSFCPSCGTEVTAGASFCIKCGDSVAQVPGTARTVTRPSAETIATQEQRLQRLLRDATLGEYEILGEIGRGGMAVVFLGHELALDRKVAIKVMSPALMLMDAGIQERFKREARTAAALSHPNIIPVFAVKETTNLVYFVMKYIAGRSLESVVKEVGALPLPVAQTILGQVGAALGYAHRRGIVHRDMKPGNVMLDEEGWVVVADFGIAKVAQAQALTVTGGVVGTPAYMSPEQCSGGEIAGQSDQYSCGVMAYEMITGRQPFASGTLVNLMYDHCHTPPPPLLEQRPDCPPEVAAAVMRMLEKDPAKRWPTMEDAVAAVGVSAEDQKDAVKTQLQTFVQPETAERLLDKFRTPGSPVPLSSGGAKRAATPRPTPAAPVSPEAAPATRRRPGWPRLLWGIPLIAILGVAGWIAFHGRGPSGIVVPPGAPPPSGQVPTLAVARLDVAPLSATLSPGERMTFHVTAHDPNGQLMTQPSVTWESSAPQVASVSGDGVVLATGPGTAELRVRSGSSSAAAVVTVNRPGSKAPAAASASVASVAVDPTSLALTVGETAPLQALLRDQAGNALAGRPVRWRTNDSGVARVSPNGLVTALGVGTAGIELVVDGRVASATVTVTAASAATLDVAPTRAVVQVGGTVQLKATPHDRAGAALANHSVSWQSSDPQTATVSATGAVSGARPGTVTITATSGTAVATATVVVEAVPAPGAVDQRPEIERVIETYRRAIEARDVTQLRSAYPGLTAEQERAWRDFYGSVTELAATFRVQDLQVSGDHATARVAATYDFRAGRRQTQNLDLTMTLEHRLGGWRLSSIK